MATVEEFRNEVNAGLDNIQGDLDNVKAKLEEALAGQGAAREAGIQEALEGLAGVRDRIAGIAAQTPDEPTTPEGDTNPDGDQPPNQSEQ